MANDDFTAHDDKLTPEAGEHAPEDAAANPFYTEVPAGDLVIDNDIVFDEADAPAADNEGGEEIGNEFVTDHSLVDPAHAEVPEYDAELVSSTDPDAADENAQPEELNDEAPHDYTVTDFGGAGSEVSLEADALPQNEEPLEDVNVHVSTKPDAAPSAETPLDAEESQRPEDLHTSDSSNDSDLAGDGELTAGPHDYTVTDFGGAGSSVALEADDLPQEGEFFAASTDDRMDEEPPVELIVEDSLSSDGGASVEGLVTEAARVELGGDSVNVEPAPYAGEVPVADSSLEVEFDPDSDPELTRPAILPENGVPSVLASNAQLTPVGEVEIPVEDEDIVTPGEVIEAEARPLFPPKDPVPTPVLAPEYTGALRSTTYANASPQTSAEDISGESAAGFDSVPAEGESPRSDAITPDAIVSETVDSQHVSVESTHVAPVHDEPVHSDVAAAEPPAAEEIPTFEEPPAVASAIPVTPPARGDDSTWQEISRRRSLFHPVSEPTPTEEAPAADDAPTPIPSAFVAPSAPVDPTSAAGIDLESADSVREVDEADIHTTTIPVASAEEIANYQPGPHSGEIPLDVLSGREKDVDELSTTMMRRDLLATPPSTESDTAASWHQALHDTAAPLPAGDTPQKLDDAIFEGTTVIPVVPSRVSAHVLSLLLTLILAPLTWYFLADAGARMTLAEGAPIATGQVSLWALAEFALGIIGFILIVSLAVRSSLGAWVSGLILTITGLPWLLAPAAMLNLTQAGFDWISSLGVLGRNLAHHLQVSAYSGRILMLGIALWAIGIVSHSVRRRGRAEESLRAEVERVNPVGAHLSWSARRRAAKEASRNERATS